MRENKQQKDLELYLHIPFCLKKCEYCDFLSGPSTLEIRKNYVEAFCKEIQAAAKNEDGRKIRSIFIGGGTPSLLEPELMKKVLESLKNSFQITGQTEFTIEANPGTLNEEKLRLYLEYGVNRLSMGLQSTYEDDLRMLGRIHSYQDFYDNYQLARRLGFQNINVDLMSAIPNQTADRWKHILNQVADLEPEHISAYSLIIEEGTPFYERELKLPDEEVEYEMYEMTKKVLSFYGYQQYEISNYAKKGMECRHNIGYWKREEYLGIGLGASSFLDGKRFSNTRNMQEYLQNSWNPETIRKDEIDLSKMDEMEEFMFLGLRMTDGVSEKEFEDEFGISLREVYGDILEKYKKSGHLIQENNSWRFSREGIHVSNWILADFLRDDDQE